MLSIIIPAHNEENRIIPTLEHYGKFFSEKKKKEKVNYEIIVVINNTRDKTPEIVKKFSKRFRKIKSLNFEQGGKGFAISEGFKKALEDGATEIGFVDADMSTSPEAFYELYCNLENYDGIIGSRWVKGADTKRDLGKYIRSRGFNLLVRALFLFSYKDTQCGAKIFKKHVVEAIIKEINITKWAFDINLLYLCKRNKFSIREYPTVWADKEGSHINSLKVPIQMAAGSIRLRLLYSPFKDFIRLYDRLPERIKIHHNIK